VAAGAVRAGFVDALMPGQAGDADVQEAAEKQAEEEGGELEGEGRRHKGEYKWLGLRGLASEQHSGVEWVLTTVSRR